MKKASMGMFYLCIIFLLILSACGPDLTIELPPEDTPVPEVEVADPVDEPEKPPEVDEMNLDELLGVGTAMKWYDDGYLVFVPAGEVTLGDNENENNLVHSVFVDDYWIYMFNVTNGQYRQCIATGACTPPVSEAPYPDIDDPELKDQPVIGVNWEQAGTYCNWMKGRLPTEAEWEKAARGPEARTYPWGEDDPDCDLLNYSECENLATTKVFEYQEGRSFYQAFDMAGNTFEWVFDLYEDDFISQLPGEIPAGPPNGTERSVRGSSYLSEVSEEELIPSAQLFYLEPDKYRPDLGFRCVIGEAVPKSFANPCVLTAFLGGVPAPWEPAPTTDENELPDFEEGICVPEKDVDWTYYCANEATQTGGLDLTITGLNESDAYLNSYSSNGGVYCAEENNPIGCFGPEGASVSFEICASCTPKIIWNAGQFFCSSCYTLTDTDPPSCVYVGGQPAPGGTCPAGYVYDPVEDICVKLVMDSEECQDGYEYDSDSKCCTASFADPSQGPGQLSNSYLVCPPGYGNVELVGQDFQEGLKSYATCNYFVYPTSDTESCEVQTYNLGECADPRCTNPSSYSNKSSCEAALCKWVTVIGGPPDYCTFPQ